MLHEIKKSAFDDKPSIRYTRDRRKFSAFLDGKKQIFLGPDPIDSIKDSDALKIFPEAKGYVNNRKKEIANEIRELIIFGNQIKDTCLKIKDLKERELAEELFMELKVNLPIKTLEDELKRLNKMTDVQYIKDNLDKVKAKNRPISDFIDFNNAGFSKCLWHSEKTGSMKYYPADNHVFCFSCQKSADSIEVIMKLKGCSFKEALQILN